MPSTLDECITVIEVINFYESHKSDDELEIAAMYRIAEISSENDKKLANILEYRNLMIDAVDFCDKFIVEIKETLIILDDAYSNDEWEQFVNSNSLDYEKLDVAKKIINITQLLHEFKGFLYDISESIEEIYTPEFDFGWNNIMSKIFFGDFWDTELNIDKIIQAYGEIQLLSERINYINAQFLVNLNEVEEMIQVYVNNIWETITTTNEKEI